MIYETYNKTLRNEMKWKNFQENINLPNNIQEKVKNRSISLNIFKFSQRYSPFPDSGDSVSKFSQTSKVQMISMSFKLFQRMERDGTLSNSFYKFNITFTSMPTKITQKKNRKKILEPNLIHNYRYKELKLNISKLNTAVYLKNNTSLPSRIQKWKDGSTSEIVH